MTILLDFISSVVNDTKHIDEGSIKINIDNKMVLNAVTKDVIKSSKYSDDCGVLFGKISELGEK